MEAAAAGKLQPRDARLAWLSASNAGGGGGDGAPLGFHVRPCRGMLPLRLCTKLGYNLCRKQHRHRRVTYRHATHTDKHLLCCNGSRRRRRLTARQRSNSARSRRYLTHIILMLHKPNESYTAGGIFSFHHSHAM